MALTCRAFPGPMILYMDPVSSTLYILTCLILAVTQWQRHYFCLLHFIGEKMRIEWPNDMLMVTQLSSAAGLELRLLGSAW